MKRRYTSEFKQRRCTSVTVDEHQQVLMCAKKAGHPGQCLYKPEEDPAHALGHVEGSEMSIGFLLKRQLDRRSFPEWCKRFGVIFHSKFKQKVPRCTTIEKAHIEAAYVENRKEEMERINIYGELTRQLCSSWIISEAK